MARTRPRRRPGKIYRLTPPMGREKLSIHAGSRNPYHRDPHHLPAAPARRSTTHDISLPTLRKSTTPLPRARPDLPLPKRNMRGCVDTPTTTSSPPLPDPKRWPVDRRAGGSTPLQSQARHHSPMDPPAQTRAQHARRDQHCTTRAALVKCDSGGVERAQKQASQAFMRQRAACNAGKPLV